LKRIGDRHPGEAGGQFSKGEHLLEHATDSLHSIHPAAGVQSAACKGDILLFCRLEIRDFLPVFCRKVPMKK
jgi:hypothetical protein